MNVFKIVDIKSVVPYFLLSCYFLCIILVFPLIVDFLKTFFYLKKYYQNEFTNIPFLIVSYLVLFFVSFPFLSCYFFKRIVIRYKNGIIASTKKSFLIKLLLVFCYYSSIIVFVMFSFNEIGKIASSNRYYSDCKKALDSLQQIDKKNNIAIYVEHIPFLFWNSKNVHSRVLPLENRVKDIRDIIILTDNQNDYFYLNAEGLYYSKITDEVALYSNSQSFLSYLREKEYSISNSFNFDKEISLNDFFMQNKINGVNKQYIELKKLSPIFYSDQFLYAPGNYSFDIELKGKSSTKSLNNSCIIELHLGKIKNRKILKENELVSDKFVITDIPINLYSFEQGTFISITSVDDSEIILKSVKVKKM